MISLCCQTLGQIYQQQEMTSWNFLVIIYINPQESVSGQHMTPLGYIPVMFHLQQQTFQDDLQA